MSLSPEMACADRGKALHDGRQWVVTGWVVAVCGALLLLYAGHVALLFVGATEGDTPPASSLPLPLNAEVLGETKECASGGCWAIFTVRPPLGVSPEDLAAELGLTPQARIAGSLLDPRTIWLAGSVQGDELQIRADYWSTEWVP